MCLQEAAPRARAGAALLGPFASLRRELEAGHHPVADALQEVVLVPHVVVERHRLGADLAGDPAHGDRIESLGVHDVQGRLDDPVAREAFAGLRGSHGTFTWFRYGPGLTGLRCTSRVTYIVSVQ